MSKNPDPRPLISGFGSYVPPRVVTNHDLAKIVDTNDAWIVERTGIRERHLAEESVTNVDLGFEAAQKTLARSGVALANITHVLYATCTADAAFPSCACQLAHRLNLKGTLALDINAACTSFVYGLEIARSLAIANPEASVLLVASDILSKRLNWEDRSTCVLFGDGAGAAVITGYAAPALCTPTALTAKIIDITCSSDGALGNLLYARGGFSSHPYKLGDTVGPEYFLHMQGRDVFKHAVRSMAQECTYILQKNDLTLDDVNVIIPHQANQRIIEAVGSRINADPAKVFVNVHCRGNTSAASIPLALSDALDQGAVKTGDTVLFVTFGAGFTWAAALMQF